MVVGMDLSLASLKELTKVRMLGKILKLDHSSGSIGPYKKRKFKISINITRTYTERSIRFVPEKGEN